MKNLLEKTPVQHGDGIVKTAVQFIKFGFVGLSNTIISMLIYYFFIWINPDLYMVGNVAGWIVSVFTGFCLNNRFVFSESEKGFFEKLMRTYIAYLGSFFIGNALLFIQVKLLGIPVTLAPWINMAITIPLNFILNKFWAFKA